MPISCVESGGILSEKEINLEGDILRERLIVCDMPEIIFESDGETSVVCDVVVVGVSFD